MNINTQMLKDTIKVMENEKLCVLRNTHKICNRKCGKCDLVLPDGDIISAYNCVLAILYTFLEEVEK